MTYSFDLADELTLRRVIRGARREALRLGLPADDGDDAVMEMAAKGEKHPLLMTHEGFLWTSVKRYLLSLRRRAKKMVPLVEISRRDSDGEAISGEDYIAVLEAQVEPAIESAIELEASMEEIEEVKRDIAEGLPPAERIVVLACAVQTLSKPTDSETIEEMEALFGGSLGPHVGYAEAAKELGKDKGGVGSAGSRGRAALKVLRGVRRAKQHRATVLF